MDYSKSLREENTFSLSRPLSQKEFIFSGYDDIFPIFSYDLFISQEGSKMVFLFDIWGEDSTPSSIYVNEDSLIPLSDRHYTNVGGNDLIYCDIKKNEVDYFQDYGSGYSPMYYDIFCGHKLDIYAFAYKLDTTKYPIFKIKKLIFPEEKVLTYETQFTLIADIEGSLSE